MTERKWTVTARKEWAREKTREVLAFHHMAQRQFKTEAERDAVLTHAVYAFIDLALCKGSMEAQPDTFSKEDIDFFIPKLEEKIHGEINQ